MVGNYIESTLKSAKYILEEIVPSDFNNLDKQN